MIVLIIWILLIVLSIVSGIASLLIADPREAVKMKEYALKFLEIAFFPVLFIGMLISALMKGVK